MVIEKRKIHNDLHDLMDKYEKMARKIGSSLMDHQLSTIDLPYSAGVMVVLVSPNSKLLQIELYDGSKDSIEHLKMLKIHMVFHGFLGGRGLEPYNHVPMTALRSSVGSS